MEVGARSRGGGGGFCGWPTSLYLSARGHEVFVAGTFSRRRWDKELSAGSLTRISDLEAREPRWEELTGRKIEIAAGDLADEHFVYEIVDGFSTDVLVHFSEQRPAHILEPDLASFENPRAGKEEHYYNAINTSLLALGLKPHLLDEETVERLHWLRPCYG